MKFEAGDRVRCMSAVGTVTGPANRDRLPVRWAHSGEDSYIKDASWFSETGKLRAITENEYREACRSMEVEP